MSVQHVVLMGFDPALGEADVAEMRAQVASWPDAIGGFEALALGPPISTERARDYHYLLYLVVADEAALERYQVHPVHQKFARWVAERSGSVLAFDYTLDSSTVVVPGAGR